MPLWSNKLTYCVANVAAALVGLYVAFWLDLDRPYWVVFTVFVISKPISGAVRAKGVYRFVGTLIGASMSVFLVPPLVQSPILLSLAVSIWVGLCLFLSLQDRTPRSYAFLLAGYSVAIVGLSVVNTPTAIFDVALARLEEISIGIICAAVAHSVFFPNNYGDVLRSKAEAVLAKSALAASYAIGSPPKTPSTTQIASIGGTVTELHTLYSQIGFETSNVRRVPAVMAGLLDRISIILPKASIAARALMARQEIDQLSDSFRTMLDDAANVLTALATGKPANADVVLSNLEAYSEMLDEADPTERTELEQLAIRHTIELLNSVLEGRVLASVISTPEAAHGVAALLPDNVNRPLYRDQALALLSAASATGATLVACALWIWNSWPEGYVAAQFAAICCSLFSTFDRPANVISKAVVAIIVSLPIAAIYEFAILPGIDGFASLALVLLPILALCSFLQTYESLEGAGVVLAVAFSGALALQETFASDFAVFVNSNLAEICGPLIAIAMILVFRTLDPEWNANRIMQSAWSSVRNLVSNAPKDSKAWILQMFDRIGMAAERLGGAAVHNPERDLLRDLRIGLNVIALRDLKGQFAATIGLMVQETMSCLSDVCRTATLDPSKPSAGLIRRLDVLAGALSELPQSEERLEGLVAVNGLRLDFGHSAA
jgi:uncharacterized membrane protein YccC